MSVYIPPATRALDVWRAIQGKPSSVAFTRLTPITDDAPVSGPTTLAAQTVRVEKDNRPRELRGEAGEGTELHCIVYGVRDHPDAAVTDTDIERGDTFEIEGDHYIVDYVNLVPGGKQAVCVLQATGVGA